MPVEELDRNEAHRKAQWLAYQKHLAEVEELHALEQAYERATQQVVAMQAQLLDARLDRQRAELSWKAIHLARQIGLVDSFRSDLRTFVRDVADPLHILRQIREKLKEPPCEAIDWTAFEVKFRSTYPEFQSRLISRYPRLTEMELKVGVLLKLKLASGDIGKLLCISERGVEGYRLRIGRKMGLAHSEDIHTVFAAI
jgi:DNA-binding CsgD family transcriptional regulator